MENQCEQKHIRPLTVLTNRVTGMLSRRRVRIQRRRTVLALNALDNQTLKDLAICRTEIPSMAACGWHRRQHGD